MTNSIVPMNLQHVPQVVQVHLDAFPGFFLSFLGKNFLSVLYTGILNDSSGIAYVFDDGQKILGFVAGTDNPKGFYKRILKRYWYRFGFALIFPILKNPQIIPRLLRAFHRDRAEDVHSDCATLMSIAVSRFAQNSGIGQQLLNAFLNEVQRRGVKRVNLTTDAVNNDKTNIFYLKHGFWLNNTFTTPEGRIMNEYMFDF